MGRGVKAVIFDIGNVCIKWDPRNLYQKLITDPKELDWFLKEVVTLEWHTHHDAGRSFGDGCANLSQKYPDYEALIHEFDKRWDETIIGSISSTIDMLVQLTNKGIPCFCLTNYSAEKFPDLAKQHSWISLFQDIIVSGEVEMVKPDPKLFALTMDHFNLKPNEALFVDDRLENIQAGERVGLIGHHYKDGPALRTDLIKHGLLAA
jgi:2-haloacid dehalogenase